MMFRSDEVKREFLSRAKARNVELHLDLRRSQFLDLEDHVFVEIVISDGGQLNAFEQLISEVKAVFPDLTIHSIVRALWDVESIEYIGVHRAAGGMTAASTFEAALRAKTRRTSVSVVVTYAASIRLEEIKKEQGYDSPSADLVRAWHLEIVKDTLWLNLASGGLSYWDPLRFPEVEVAAATADYVATRTRTFRELESALNYTLDEVPGNPLLLGYFEELNRDRVSLASVDDALRRLPSEAFGGPYLPGSTFETSAAAAFEKLNSKEQQLIRARFKERLRQLREQLPELERQFPTVFR